MIEQSLKAKKEDSIHSMTGPESSNIFKQPSVLMRKALQSFSPSKIMPLSMNKNLCQTLKIPRLVGGLFLPFESCCRQICNQGWTHQKDPKRNDNSQPTRSIQTNNDHKNSSSRTGPAVQCYPTVTMPWDNVRNLSPPPA